jgi:NADP-dependent 3-hydroxy acid dehydrogenase YdfG
MLAVTGASSQICKAVVAITGETLIRIPRMLEATELPMYNRFARRQASIPGAPRYLLAAGVLTGKVVNDQTIAQINEAFWVNAAWPIKLCEQILAENPDARICVVGSQSATRGSFDQIYAASKAALHAYVLNRSTRSPQQLFAVAPGIIADCGMTLRRHDFPSVLRRRKTVTAEQVAKVIVRHLWDRSVDPLTNAIVPVEEAAEC